MCRYHNPKGAISERSDRGSARAVVEQGSLAKAAFVSVLSAFYLFAIFIFAYSYERSSK